MKASGGNTAPARTAKAASVAVARVHGGSSAAAADKPAAKVAAKPAAKPAPQPQAKAAPKVAAPAAAKPAIPAKPPVPAKPAVPARPAVRAPVAQAAAAPQVMKVAAAAPSAPTSHAPTSQARAEQAAAAAASRHPMPPPVPAPQPGHLDRRPGQIDRNPPRPMSKAEIFVEGDYVVYPTHGVGKVERIATEEIAGHRLELIHITFEENRMTLRVPVSKARSAGLRKLATRKLFDEAMALLKGRARIKRTMWSRRAQEYEAKINSGDPLAIAEVVRDLHRNAGQPDQSFSERQIYEAAMDRLAAELAALDKTDKPTAVIKLGDFLKTV
jgi:CarD family transcriptional regulator